ncbi:MAG: hypothetical protein V4450_08950 [Bacteroidota bacterium]
MNYTAFKESLSLAFPPESLSVMLTALWYDGKGDWETAHELINDRTDNISAHIHAYLHRKEGDIGNARYWYSRSGILPSEKTLNEEWEELVQRYL